MVACYPDGYRGLQPPVPVALAVEATMEQDVAVHGGPNGQKAVHVVASDLGFNGDAARERHVRYPVTPDGRYFVVRGRLWRCTNPALDAEDRTRLTRKLMAARRDKGHAIRAGDATAREDARQRVDAAKHALGERGPPWWTDGSPDFNRRMVQSTPYKSWYEGLGATQNLAVTAPTGCAPSTASRSG